MPQRLTDANIAKQLDTVADRLAADRCSKERRLELLRKQAQLGDLRDAAVTEARRAADDDRRGR